MKVLKNILITLVVIFLLLVVISFFLPNKPHVEVTKKLNASPEAIFAQINDFKNWESWDAWHQLDSTMQLDYSNPASGVGAWYAWTSQQKNVGSGKMQMLESVPNERIKGELTFMGMGGNTSEIILKPTEGGTEVTMTYNGDLTKFGFFQQMMWKYGATFFGNPMIKKMHEKSLANLEVAAKDYKPEPVAAKTQYNFESVDITPMWIATIKDSSKVSELSGKFAAMYGEIAKFAGENKLQISGKPFSIYHSWPADMENGYAQFEPGFPVTGKAKGNKRVNVYETKGAKAIKTVHTGGYMASGNAHMAMDEYLKANNKTVNGSVWEIYIVGPGENPDSTQWITEIYYPVAE